MIIPVIDSTKIPAIAGFTAGIISTTLLLPLDIVKLRLQVTESSNVDPNKKYANFRSIRIAGGIIKYEGIIGLYQGWTPAVLGSSISWGGYFYFYETLKRLYIQQKLLTTTTTTTTIPSTIPTTTNNNNNDILTSFDHFILAVSASSIMVGITNPIWLIKTRMQLQLKRSSIQYNIQPYRNMFDAINTIIREEGIVALYKGVGPALLLTSHGGIQFMVYEALRKRQHLLYNTTQNINITKEQKKKENVWKRFQMSFGYLTIGAISKLVATTATYPLQLMKTRIQQRSVAIELTDEGGTKFVKHGSYYNTLRSTFLYIYQKEGIGGFFKGVIPNGIRVMPGAAITFLVYEEVTDLLSSN